MITISKIDNAVAPWETETNKQPDHLIAFLETPTNEQTLFCYNLLVLAMIQGYENPEYVCFLYPDFR